MKVLNSLVFLFSIASIFETGTTQENDEDGLRTFRFHENERPCTYRREQGFCQRRSACKRPTRHICRFGLNPVVCCLDESEPKTTTTTTTTKRPTTTKRLATTTKPLVTTKRGVVKPDTVKDINLTFPGCGYRAPRIQGTTKPNSNARSSNNRGGIFSRRGKRSVHLGVARSRRGVQKVIVGGVEAVANSWPWMVAIFKQNNPQVPKRFLCGASLISKKYVLSAAHCFDGEKGNIDPTKFTILVGSHTTKEGTEYPVESILIHSSYKTRQYYSDISLLRLGKEVTLTQKVYPVCLPSSDLRNEIIPGNNNVTVLGWGDTSFGGPSSKVLQELTIPIVPLKQCNESFSKLALVNFPQGITDIFMCAGVEEGGKDACQGDSGGPLTTKLKGNAYAQLGIVSFGYGCARAGFPGVYTRVSKFTSWLYDNTDLGK